MPAPGTTLALAERPILPVFLPPSAPTDATPWAILSWGSVLLHGMSRSLRHRSLDRRHLSWGFYAATTLGEKRVHVRLSSAPRFCRGVCPRVPSRRLRCRSQVFPTSQRPSSSLHRPTIFRWVASVRFALQGVVPSTKPRRLVVVRPTLLTLLPRADRSPFLGGDTRRRGGSYLGAFNRRLWSSTGSSSSWKSIGHSNHYSQSILSDLPLLGFHLLMVCTRATGEGFPPLDR